MLVGPSDLGVQGLTAPTAAQLVVEEVQRPLVSVRAHVLGHLTRGRVQPESQELDHPVAATAAAIYQVSLGLGMVQLQPVLVESGAHGCEEP